MTAGHLGVSSPMLEVFVRGDVPREVRLLAARGLATSVDPDRLVLLALMTTDADPEVAALASATIDALPMTALDEVFARPDVPPQVRAFFEQRRPPAVADRAEAVHPTVLTAAVVSDDVPPAMQDAAAALPAPTLDAGTEGDDAAAEVSATVVAALEQVASVGDEAEEVVHQLLTALPVPDKIKLATLGRREQRAILIRDPNRIVSTAVMASPKLTETEVEMFARMQNVSEEVLRIIGMSRVWVKSYNIVAALVKNPRTPPSVSLPLLSRLQEREVKALTVNRNLPESVRLAAKKFLAVQQERRGG